MRATIILLIAVSNLLGGCSDEDGGVNLAPSLTLESGPIEGDTVSYHLTLSWTGSDPDGRINRYEVAIDPPIEFSDSEIAAGGPGIAGAWLIGSNGAPDTTRVTKVVNDRAVFFDWIHTASERRTFSFSSDKPESLDVASSRRPTGRFLGMHAVYVRAVDDEETASKPERVAFTSSTIAPSSEIVYPALSENLMTLGTSALIRWQGIDADASSPERQPRGYLYRILDADTIPLPCSAIENAEALFALANAGDPGWIYQDADTTELMIPFPGNGCYLMGVRAIDDAGAIEPFLDLGRNAFKFITSGIVGPTITIEEPALGTFVFRRFGIAPAEGAADRPLRFSWSATAEEYGGIIEAYSWGVDLADPDPRVDSGWSPWSDKTTSPDFTLGPGYHTFMVRVRDTVGSVGAGRIDLQLVTMTFEEEALYVDDFADEIFPRPENHDAFWFSLFDPVNSEGRFHDGEVSQWDVFGLNDVAQFPLSPSLEQLGHYKLLLWSVNGAGYNGASGLLAAAGRSRTLGTYLRAGGTLLLTGLYTVAATTPPMASGIANFTYPKLLLGPGDFAWDFLKIRSGRVDNDMGTGSDNRFVSAIPADSVFGGPHIYGGMDVDGSKFNPRSLYRSIAYVDGVFGPILGEQSTSFRGDLDSLYVYGTAARAAGRESPYDYGICALRWHDPDPAREHGRVQWFGFPLYYFKTAQVQDTFNKSIDWFREETP